ncbi:MAG TPA: hypothetical protein VGC52_08285 [Gemmatimonadaceae bacterium]
MRRIAIAAAVCCIAGSSARAQVRVNPTGVSVNTMNATTVFLTFGGVGSLVPSDAFWCGELLSAAPDVGQRCDPATIFGQLPERNDLSRVSGAGALTDIMSIPASVARRAYQAAARGETSTFFYVRRFRNVAGGPDQYVAVTCRLTGGGARVPFALTDVRVAFEPPVTVQHVRPGETPPPLSAVITYNGTGRLLGRWEVVMPGEEPPTDNDLLTEATLPLEERTAQRRYLPVDRFNVFLPPSGRAVLPGPDPRRLPTAADGTYLVLLRIEASDDRESDSDLGAVGAGSGILHNGAVAGFPMPVLRYEVGDGESVAALRAPGRGLALVSPGDSASIAADSSVVVRWSGEPGAALYRIEFVADEDGSALHQAAVRREVGFYEVPSFVRERAQGRLVRWRVVALSASGSVLRRSSWSVFRFNPL